jgi:DnaK suppressor protein
MVGKYTAALFNKQSELELLLKPSSSIREGIEIDVQADEIDNITSRQQRETALEGIRRATSTLNRVKAALQRIQLGSFGICLSCEEEISDKRLKAIPWAEFCIRCQESADILAAEEGRIQKDEAANQDQMPHL